MIFNNKKVTEQKMCVLIFLIFSTLARNISHSKKKCERYDNMYNGLHIKYPSFLLVFNET
jgi:hypothetical protein